MVRKRYPYRNQAKKKRLLVKRIRKIERRLEHVLGDLEGPPREDSGGERLRDRCLLPPLGVILYPLRWS